MDMIQKVNEYVERKRKESENNSNDMVPISLSTNPALNPNILKERIKNVNDISEKELYDMLYISYSSILTDIFIHDDKETLDMFFNSKFLNVFTHVINSIRLSPNEIIYCNKLVYDYLTIGKDKNDQYTKSLLLNLSKNVNSMSIPKLLSLGLPEEFCIFIALARNSSLKESVNIRRMNHLIISSSASIMSEQMIVDIYQVLIDNFTELFKSTMYDPYSDEELNNISDGAGDIYSNMSLAIIDILNTMSSTDIRKVLLSYAMDYKLTKNTTNIRFSIKTLSISEYQRIYDVVDFLLTNESIIVP